jgi:hypothetical protein
MMPRMPTNAQANLLAQAGAADAPRGGKSEVKGEGAFHKLLPPQEAAMAPATQAPAGALAGDAGAGAEATATAGAGGLARKGASGAQLVALKVTVAGGLRTLETETMQAIRAALDSGDRAKASALLKGAAQVVGAMLGGMDAAQGSNAVDRIVAVLAALKDGAGASPKPGVDAQKGDPLTQAEAMFALVAQALGLVRVAAATQAQAGDPAAKPLGLGGRPGAGLAAANGGAAASAAPLSGLVETMIRAGQLARGAEVSADPMPGGTAVAGKAGPGMFGPGLFGPGMVAQGKSGVGITAPGHGAPTAAKVTDKRVPDPMALLAQTGAGGADGRSAAMLAAAGAVSAHLSAATTLGAAPGAAATMGAAQASAPPPQAFAGMLGNQIRAAQPTDGVTRIALSPRGLGEIQIDMKRDSSGRLNVVLRVENPLVLAALRNDHLRLSQMFASPTPGPQPTLDFETFSGRDGQGGRQQPKRAATALGAVGGAEGAEADTGADTGAETGATPRQDRIGRGALDIRT